MYHRDTNTGGRKRLDDTEDNDPLEPAAATELIGKCQHLRYTKHARERMVERGLIIGDVLHVLKHGTVRRPGNPSTQRGFFKYEIECVTPNSNGRTARLVVIPSAASGFVKVITVMWSNEIEE
jgi:hypothetical protein